MRLYGLPRIGRGTADTADSPGHRAACRQVRRGSGEIRGRVGGWGLLKGEEDEANWVDPYSCSTGILTDGGRRDKNDLKKDKKKVEEEQSAARFSTSEQGQVQERKRKKKRAKPLVPLD